MSGFSNPVANAAGTLIRTVLKSLGFQTGVTGWQITRSGDAEFNSGTFRGGFILGNNVVVMDGTTGEITITGTSGAMIVIDPTATNPVIRFISEDGTNDAFINMVGADDVADLGLNSGKYTPSDGTERRIRLYFNDSGDRAEFAVIKESTQQIMGGYSLLTSTGGEIGYRDVPGGAGVHNFVAFGADSMQINVVGWPYRIDSAAASAAIGAEAIVLTSPSMTLKNGRCYEVEFGGNITTAVANNFLLSRVRVTNLAGAVKLFHEQKVTDIGPQFWQYYKGFIKRTAGTDLTGAVLVLTTQGSAGNLQWTGAATDVRYMNIRDAGKAGDFPNAITI